MIKLSSQQQDIIDAPLTPMSVIACAGSGKTETAVRRLLAIKKLLGETRTHVALLSFSNVAVNTFKTAYLENNTSTLNHRIDKRVTIDTFDGFITSNILRPHAYRTMGCKQVPFLITGFEPFLENDKFKFWYTSPSGKSISIRGKNLNDVMVDIERRKILFKYSLNNNKYYINSGLDIVKNLGELGAYTHEFGKYWALKTLVKQSEILRVLAHRYQHIIVDEAQDIGIMHQFILKLLIREGVKVTLIGDPNQAIYEFAGADGEYIKNFNNSSSNESYDLTLNYRSIPDILNVANNVSSRKDNANKTPTNDNHGAYFAIYEPNNHKDIVDVFISKLNKAELSIDNSAVLCRSNAEIGKLRLVSNSIGQGKLRLFTQASIERDANHNYQKAFKLVTNGIIGLLENTPNDLVTNITNSRDVPEAQDIRKDIWFFVRSSEEGLPLASLKASTEWHPLIIKRVSTLLETIESKYGYKKTNRIGNKLAKTKLLDKPLTPDAGLDLQNKLDIRVDTVHQAKGESLDAVLYIAKKPHIEAMLNDENTELSRIGYVAVTRAKKLFLLAVPRSASKSLIPKLKKIGLKEL